MRRVAVAVTVAALTVSMAGCSQAPDRSEVEASIRAVLVDYAGDGILEGDVIDAIDETAGTLADQAFDGQCAEPAMIDGYADEDATLGEAWATVCLEHFDDALTDDIRERMRIALGEAALDDIVSE